MLSEDRIIRLAEQENNLHPLANLVDYYKLFYQSIFGPAHFIESADKARDYLQRELASATSFEALPYQKINFLETYYRVNLSVIIRKLVSPEDFCSGFLRSIPAKTIVSLQEWTDFWHKIEAALKKSSLKISDFEEASRRLDFILKSGKQTISHSRTYREAYHPHYRLFNQTEFEKLQIEEL